MKKTKFISLFLLLSLVLFSVSCAPKKTTETEKFKVGFIYVGPVGDYGWSNAHDVGRKFAESQLPWLETTFVEAVAEGDAPRYIDRLITEENCDVVITTSFGYGPMTIEAGKKYPDKKFLHCSGLERLDNVGTYFIDLYQLYYLNGLMAGALTKSNQVGYVGAFAIPEVIRHINAFALGVREVNPNAKVNVKWINAWYDPAKAKEAAEALIAEGCDALAFTEDSPTVIQTAKEHVDKGEMVYTFSHYSPMQSFGENTVVSGQLCDWGPMYVKLITELKENTYKSGDLLWLVKDKGAILGGAVDVPINPAFVPALQAVMINHPTFQNISVYDLVMKRYDQFKESDEAFQPFTGPLKDQEGKVQIAEGQKATMGELLQITWFIDSVVGSLK